VASYLFWADTNGVHCGGVSNAQEGNNVPTQCIHMTNETQTKFEMLNVQKCSLRIIPITWLFGVSSITIFMGSCSWLLGCPSVSVWENWWCTGCKAHLAPRTLLVQGCCSCP